MVRVCGWCQRFLGVKAPLDQWTATHGICESCRERLIAGPQRSPAQRPGAVLILSRDVPAVAAHLGLPARAYLEPTIIVWDRCYVDRRRNRQPVAIERRQSERRARVASPWTRGVLFLPLRRIKASAQPTEAVSSA